MYVKSREELAALLEFIGYTEDKRAPPSWSPKMVGRYPNQPEVYLCWINGCRIDNKFLSFTEAWRYIQEIIGTNHDKG